MEVPSKLPRRLRRQPPTAPDGRTPPAWYPDPLDRRRLRHWDGEAWGAEVRPGPAWSHLSTLPAPSRTSGPQRRLRVSHWLAMASLGLFLAALAAYSSLRAVEELPPGERVDDPQFIAAAKEACAAATLDIGELDRPRLTASGREKGRYVERLAHRFELLVDDLRALPVDADDAAAVARYLDAYGAYATNGHRYARALAAGKGSAEAVRAEADDELRTVVAFERANGLLGCPP